MSDELDRVPRRRLDARARNVRGTMYLAGPEHAFELSEVGAAIWRLVDGSRTIRDIGAALADDYEVDPDQAARDAAELLEELASRQIVELDGGGAA